MLQSIEEIKKIQTIYGVFYCQKEDLITEQLEKYSAHTRNELSMLKSAIREGDNILDIGAHIGTFSIPFSIFNNKRGRIYSFEAHPNNYKLFIMNIEANNLNELITPINAVVSEEDNVKWTASLPNDGNTGMYYFLPNSGNTETATFSINIDNWHSRQPNQDRIHLVKIDVEGAELSVLRSCQKILQEFRPVLYIEINKKALQRFNTTCKDIEDILAPLGYHYFRNIGPRNSQNDKFKIASLKTIEEGGEFFDLLAVQPSDVRYPNKYLGGFALSVFRIRSRLSALTRRFTRRLFRFAS